MNLYADTSALIKRYVRESGSDQVIALLDGYSNLGTAALTLVEMASAMSKAGRMGWVDNSSLKVAWKDFQVHWPAYIRLPISSVIIERAAELAWRRGLRAYDAAHLSCALAWKDVTGEEVVFACFDRNLSEAAQKEGLIVWPEGEFN
jgi:uncharacterized protein